MKDIFITFLSYFKTILLLFIHFRNLNDEINQTFVGKQNKISLLLYTFFKLNIMLHFPTVSFRCHAA